MVTVVLLTDEQSSAAAGAIGEAMKSRCKTISLLDVRPRPAVPTEDCSSDEIDAPTDTYKMEPMAVSSSAAADGDAYLYYTSGSSGEPKGVCSGHAPMMNRLRWMWEQWPFAEDEVCCQRVDHVFIDFVAEVFGPLSCGVPILVVPDTVRRNPVLLGKFVAENGVTRITLVPTLARLVAEAARMASAGSEMATKSCDIPQHSKGNPCSSSAMSSVVFQSVRLWILSGEALPWTVARNLARLSPPASVLLNLYGSTEMAADITAHCLTCEDVLLSQDDDKRGQDTIGQVAPSVSIGLPISNCGVELMEVVQEPEGFLERGPVGGGPPSILHRIDPRHEGRVGMVYAWGAGLARGYWGRPTATETSFPRYVWDLSASCYRLSSADSFRCNNAGSDGEADDSGGSRENGCRDGQPVQFFRTGDLASFEKGRYGESSGLVYRGRLDQQVKLNGRRFDLAEVEACLVRASGVALGSAVAVNELDTSDGQEVGGPQSLGSLGCSLVAAVVSPETADTAIVLALCQRYLPRFVVPHVVISTSVMPTLSGSGKVDRRAVRRMVLDHLRHQRGGIGSVIINNRVASSRIQRVENVTRIIAEAVACILQSFDRDARATRGNIDESSNLFSELGLSSVQAVHLVHELRRQLPAVAVSLVDLYSHPCARSLARWLLRAAGTVLESPTYEERGLQDRAIPSVSVEGGSNTRKRNGEAGLGTPEAIDTTREQRVGFSIRPMTAGRKAETYSLFTDIFLQNEPLMSSRFRSCRSRSGPVGAAVVRRCYNRLVVRSIDVLEERGGRVLIATDDTTGQVLGVTIGTELVEPAPGSGFLVNTTASAEDADQIRSKRGSSPNFDCTEETAWRRWTGRLLGLPLEPLMGPVSALIGELLDTYNQKRGWAYEPGEVMYISETGCRSARPTSAKSKSRGGGIGGRTKSGSSDGRGGADNGVQAALLAESLERQLLCEASAAGFLRAVTICTNTVTAYVARELGFREVTRISPVQTYHPSGRQARARLFRLHLPRTNRQRLLSPDGHPGRATRGKHGPQPGPFASVGKEHTDVVLFEKILVPSLPQDLLLHKGRQEVATSVESSMTVPAEAPCAAATKNDDHTSQNAGVVVALGECWQLVRVGHESWEHHCQMLTVLADSLPSLAATGKATRFMSDDKEQGQAAFLLLTAPAAAVGPEQVDAAVAAAARAETVSRVEAADSSSSKHRGSVASSPSIWTVAACVSCRRQNTGSPGTATPLAVEARNEVEESDRKQRKVSSTQSPKAWRELLVLAVGRRWRYRGLGTALVAWLISTSRDDGDSLLYVRSLTESVGFYERHGFRTVDDGDDAGGGNGVVFLAPPLEGECLLVHDLALGETHHAHRR
ncbi:unnamed protein product [Scytosiphon promiscuus]